MNKDTDRSLRVALVTGGGGALGSATGTELAKRGFHVYLLDADGARAESAAQSIVSKGYVATGKQLDVTDHAAAQILIGGIASVHGGIDVLVNMAGVNRTASFMKISTTDLEDTFRSHVHGTINCMQAAAASMRDRSYGRIVNVSSIASLGSVGGGSYGAAKGAIESLTKAAAIEFGARNITVNCVAPGLIAAGMNLDTPKDFQDAGVMRTPMKRNGTANEVAFAISFFTAPEASFVTGQTLFVDGGISLGF